MNSIRKSHAPISHTTAQIEEMRKSMKEKRLERASAVENILNWSQNIWNQSNESEIPETTNLDEKSILNNQYTREWDSILYWKDRDVEVLYADAKSFKTPFQDEKYAIDAHNVYISWMHIPGADPKSFSFYSIKWVDSVYATDNTGKIYYKWETLPVDKETFQVVSTRSAFDKNGVYNNGRKLSGEELKKIISKYNIPLNTTALRVKEILSTKIF